MVSRPGELPFANYRKIDNAHLFAAATAAQPKVGFDLQQKATDHRWLTVSIASASVSPGKPMMMSLVSTRSGMTLRA